MTRRSPAVLAPLLPLLLAPAGRAQEVRPGDWTVLPADPAPEDWQPGLWLPMRADGERVLLGDALGRHAALHPASAARCVVTLDRLVRDPAAAPLLDWRRATLTPAGGAPLTLLEGEAWAGEAAGQETVTSRFEGATFVRLPFPAPPAACAALTLRVPVVDGVAIEVRFARWAELVAAAEADLAAWKRHVEASRERSAIAPYLDAAAYRALRGRGDTLVAAFLLRELARGEEGHDPAALPRFLALHVLADTAWGRTQAVPDHGDAAAARRVLRRWRDLGHPAVPGVAPR